MEEHVEDGPTRSCCAVMLLVLCGLPGAGKTTLARRLATLPSSSTDRGDDGLQRAPTEVRHCSFDSVYFGDDDGSAPEFEVGRWRQSRAQALERVERLISGQGEQARAPLHRLVVVDDNMYYRSMRHQCYLIAKKYEVPYGQVYVEVPLAVALARNTQREGHARVPDEVIERMHARFEKPQPDDHRWERHTFVMRREESGGDDDDALQQLWQAVVTMWSDNFVKAEAIEERAREQRRNQDREQSLASFLHRLDQQLRGQVASILAASPSGAERSAKEAGKLVATLKRSFLAEARGRGDVREFLASRANLDDAQRAATGDTEEAMLVRRLKDAFRERCLASLAPA